MARKPEPEPTVAERKAQLALDLLGDIERLRTQLWEPVVERRPMVVSDGKDLGSHVEVVDVELTEPTFTAKKTIVTAIAVAVDKLVELDAGTEVEGDGIDELAERRASGRVAAPGVDSQAASGKQRR